MNTNASQIVTVLAKVALICAAFCSTAYLLMLGWYNNLLLDDYGFVAEVDRGGAWGLMSNAYFDWQSRFSAFYVLGWILELWGHASNLIGYTVLLLVLGYAALYYALRYITAIQPKWLLCAVAMLITNVSVMAYFEISTFYWLCCALYTLSTYAAIVLFTAIFFSQGRLWARWLVVILCSLYLCGGAENFTPIIIAAFALALLYQMPANHTWRFWLTQQQRMMLVSLIILCVGFVLVITGPGTSSRATGGEMNGYMSHFAIIPYLSNLLKASAIFSMRLFSRILYFILLLPIGWLIGSLFPAAKTRDSIGLPLLLSLACVLGILLISIAAPVFGMGWYSPLRSYSFVAFVVSALFIYWGTLMGQLFTKMHTARIALILSCVLISGFSIYSFRSEKSMVADYCAQIHNCHALIAEQMQLNRTEPLQIPRVTHPEIPNSYAIMRMSINHMKGNKLPSIADPATYFPYEQFCLTTDSNDWRNQGIKHYHNAQFDILGWEKIE